MKRGYFGMGKELAVVTPKGVFYIEAREVPF
jgi:hypothetical protein